MPVSRNAGLPLRLIRRLSENTTSAEVSGSPFAKCTFFFRLNVNVFAPFEALHVETRSGTGWAKSPLLYVKRVSKMPRSTIDAVGSNARCGSDVLIVNELSTTNVDDASRCAVAARAAAVHASATRAASGSATGHLRMRGRLNWSSFFLWVTFNLIGRSARLQVGEAAPEARPASVANRQRTAPPSARAAAAPRPGSGRTRTDTEGENGSRTADSRDRAPRPAGSPAGSPLRRRAVPPRSAPPCTGAPAAPTAGRSGRSRPSARGT